MRGHVYDMALPLAGLTNSGLRHHAFSIASQGYIDANAATIVISATTGSRDQVRAPFAFYITDPALYHHEQGRQFEIDRPITPTLLAVIPTANLGQKVGTVGQGFFTGDGCLKNYGANDAIRVHFQLPGRLDALAKLYRLPRDVTAAALGKAASTDRLSIWRVQDDPHPWLLVTNDKNNRLTGFATGLRLLESQAPFPQTNLAPDDHTLAGDLSLGSVLQVMPFAAGRPAFTGSLVERLGFMNPGGAKKTDAHLAAMFGVA